MDKLQSRRQQCIGGEQRKISGWRSTIGHSGEVELITCGCQPLFFMDVLEVLDADLKVLCCVLTVHCGGK